VPRIEIEHPDLARVRPPVTLEDLDRGGLAGAVRAEQTEHLARVDRQRQTVDGAHAAVLLAEPGDLDGRGRRRHGSSAYKRHLVQCPRPAR
jgi:hypothetical protein